MKTLRTAKQLSDLALSLMKANSDDIKAILSDLENVHIYDNHIDYLITYVFEDGVTDVLDVIITIDIIDDKKIKIKDMDYRWLGVINRAE